MSPASHSCSAQSSTVGRRPLTPDGWLLMVFITKERKFILSWRRRNYRIDVKPKNDMLKLYISVMAVGWVQRPLMILTSGGMQALTPSTFNLRWADKRRLVVIGAHTQGPADAVNAGADWRAHTNTIHTQARWQTDFTARRTLSPLQSHTHTHAYIRPER